MVGFELLLALIGAFLLTLLAGVVFLDLGEVVFLRELVRGTGLLLLFDLFVELVGGVAALHSLHGFDVVVPEHLLLTLDGKEGVVLLDLLALQEVVSVLVDENDIIGRFNFADHVVDCPQDVSVLGEDDVVQIQNDALQRLDDDVVFGEGLDLPDVHEFFLLNIG